jgi:hypothetical protein
MTATTRTRNLVLRPAGKRVLELRASTGSTFTDYPFGEIVGRQSTTSEGTAWPSVHSLIRRHRENPTDGNARFEELAKQWDMGSDFLTWKNTYSGDELQNTTELVNPNFAGQQYYYTGSFDARYNGVPATSLAWPSLPQTELDNLFGMGGTAIKRTVPTSPVANTSQFLGELWRDGLPSIVGSTTLAARVLGFKQLGSEYLNVEFGWKPFVSDLRKFLTVIKHHDKVLAQYRRDSGKSVRRNYSFPSYVETTGSTSTASGVPALPSACYQKSSGVRTLVQKFQRDVWFSGAYKYYYDEGSTRLGKVHKYAQEADKLLGIRLTPDVLWDLAPWTWLSDWFANFGDVLSNLTAFGKDGLVMQYGYVMGTFTQLNEYDLHGIVLANGRGLHLHQTLGTITKARRKASPYGFGLNPAVDFTTRQWAILAALGMTRAPGLLR